MKKKMYQVCLLVTLAAFLMLFSIGCNPAGKLDPNKAQVYIATAQAANTATAPVNPYAPLISIALGAIAAGLGVWGKIKSSQVITATTTLGAVTQAIEAAPPSMQAVIKPAVSTNLAAAQITTAGKALISASKNS